MKNVTIEQTGEESDSPKHFKKVKIDLESIEEEEVDVSSKVTERYNDQGRSQIIIEDIERPPQDDLELGFIKPIQNSPPPLPNDPVTRQRVLMDRARVKLLENPTNLLMTLDSLTDLHPEEKVRLFYEINTLNYIKRTFNKMSNFSMHLTPSQQIQLFDKLFNFEEFLEGQRTSAKMFKLSYPDIPSTVKQDLSLEFVREMVLPFYQFL
jgi:hypothetical protein